MQAPVVRLLHDEAEPARACLALGARLEPRLAPLRMRLEDSLHAKGASLQPPVVAAPGAEARAIYGDNARARGPVPLQSLDCRHVAGRVTRGSATSRTRRRSVEAFTGFVTKRTPRGRW